MGSSDDIEELVRDLIGRQAESRRLDFKGPMEFGPSKADKGSLLKDIIALANTRDGGYLVIGVSENAGKFEAVGVDTAQAKSFDPTEIGNFSAKHCSVQPSVSVNVVNLNGADVVVLTVGEFAEEPIVCISDLHGTDGRSLILRAGSIYVRTVDARSVAIESGESMRAFLDLAVQKRGENLLHQIRRLAGAALGDSEPRTPAEAYKEQIEGADRFFVTEGLPADGWALRVMPVEFIHERVGSNAELKDLRRNATVSLRGWDFPHVNYSTDQAFEDGVESTNERFHIEAHRLYRSGFFAWRAAFHEDLHHQEARGKLSYVGSIYSLTEYFMFASRFMGSVIDRGDVLIQISASNLRGRPMHADPGIFFDEPTTGAQSYTYSTQVSVEELRASFKHLAAKAAQRLCELYGLDVSVATLDKWQERLIQRRF